MKHVIISIAGFVFCCHAYSQEKQGVKLLAKARRDGIVLRWAPTNSLSWSYGNQYGYRIERFTIVAGKQLASKAQKKILSPVPLKPRSLNEWKADMTTNDYSAVAAQAIFGSSFDVAGTTSKGTGNFVNKVQEKEQRYSFALLAADHSFKTALLSALGFKDSTISKDERYLYKVFIAVNDPKIKLDTGYCYLGLRDSVGLSAPRDLIVEFGDRIALLKWPKVFVEKEYTSFIIERAESKDGVFSRVNSLPFLNTRSSTKEKFFQAVDSLPQNNVEYMYRIRGITPFGETGPESERVSGEGFQAMNARATIVEAKEENGKVLLRWKVLGDANLISGFYVERASNTNKAFDQLNKNKLASSVNSFTDEAPLSTNYYRIKIEGRKGQHATSFPFLVQLIDSIPPDQPVGLKVTMDTSGIVRLSWMPNTEKDLSGYRVYRSNFATSEFSLITASNISTAGYSDTINIKRLDDKIYYKIRALDKRQNPSFFSEVVEAKLPDVIPPLAPTLIDILSKEEGILIRWKNSASDDVIKYQLLRREVDSLQWKLVNEFKSIDSTSYLDKTVKSNSNYQYRMIAVDKSGLKSALTNPVSIKSLEVNSLAIRRLLAEADRGHKFILLKWKCDGASVSKFLIYRAKEKEPLSMYGTTSGKETTYKDTSPMINTIFKYRVKAVLENGKESPFSEELIIKY